MNKLSILFKTLVISSLVIFIFFMGTFYVNKTPRGQISIKTNTQLPPSGVPVALSELDQSFLATLQNEPIPDLSSLVVTNLNVPEYRQQYVRSCEESSLRMVLAYYNIQTTDMDIVQRVGYAPRPWDKQHNIWDDPNTMFVGNIDSSLEGGYGAFAPALAKAARTFGRNAKSYSLVSANFIADQIRKGYPVMVWGFFNSPPYIVYSWQTSQGKEILAYSGEHVRVVEGIVETNEQVVIGFFLNDPLTGAKGEYWSAQRLMEHMNMRGALTNQAVVVE